MEKRTRDFTIRHPIIKPKYVFSGNLSSIYFPENINHNILSTLSFYQMFSLPIDLYTSFSLVFFNFFLNKPYIHFPPNIMKTTLKAPIIN